MTALHVTGARAARASAQSAFGRLHADRLRLAVAIIATAFLALTLFLPLWRMDLEAPQYPQGLSLTAYGTGMEGDLEEINALNHYIGVKPILQDEVLEFKLFPFMIVGLMLAILASAFVQRRWVRVAVPILVWALPIGFLADLQWWLYRFGHDLDLEAPFRFGTFTPKVIGTTQVMNFHSETMVAIGFGAMIAAALLMTLGVPVFRFVRDSWRNTGGAKSQR